MVSYGDHYSGDFITKPRLGDGFEGSSLTWSTAIAPGGMVFVGGGSRFGAWQGDAVIAGLKSQALIRVCLASGGTATEVDRLALPNRARDVTLSADGTLLVLEDAPAGRLLRAQPTF